MALFQGGATDRNTAVAGAAAVDATTAAVADTAAAGVADATGAGVADATVTTTAETAATGTADATATGTADSTVTADTTVDSSTDVSQGVKDSSTSDQGSVRLYRSGRANDPALNNLRPYKEYTPYQPGEPGYDPENPTGKGYVEPNSDQGISAYTNRSPEWRNTWTINSDQAPNDYFWRQDPEDPSHYTLNPSTTVSNIDYINQVDTLMYRALWIKLARYF